MFGGEEPSQKLENTTPETLTKLCFAGQTYSLNGNITEGFRNETSFLSGLVSQCSSHCGIVCLNQVFNGP